MNTSTPYSNTIMMFEPLTLCNLQIEAAKITMKRSDFDIDGTVGEQQTDDDIRGAILAIFSQEDLHPEEVEIALQIFKRQVEAQERMSQFAKEFMSYYFPGIGMWELR